MEFEIFLHDLKPEIQKQFLETAGIESAEEGNYDVVPVAVIFVEKIEEGNN